MNFAFLEGGVTWAAALFSDIVGHWDKRNLDALRAHLGDEEILELTYIAALYLQHAVMSRALRTEFDDRAEPVVEVAAGDAEGPRGAGGGTPPPGR